MARVLIGKRDKGLSRFYRITGNYLLRGFYGGGGGSFGITVHRRILQGDHRSAIRYIKRVYNCRISDPSAI